MIPMPQIFYILVNYWLIAFLLGKISLTKRSELMKPDALRPPEHSLMAITIGNRAIIIDN